MRWHSWHDKKYPPETEAGVLDLEPEEPAGEEMGRNAETAGWGTPWPLAPPPLPGPPPPPPPELLDVGVVTPLLLLLAAVEWLLFWLLFWLMLFTSPLLLSSLVNPSCKKTVNIEYTSND